MSVQAEICALMAAGYGVKRANLADTLCFQLRAAKIPHLREQKLIPGRKYSTDVLVDDLAIECDGSTWTNGRHSRGYGIETDCEKQNLLVIAGFRPMRFTGAQIKDGTALKLIEMARRAA